MISSSRPPVRTPYFKSSGNAPSSGAPLPLADAASAAADSPRKTLSLRTGLGVVGLAVMAVGMAGCGPAPGGGGSQPTSSTSAPAPTASSVTLKPAAQRTAQLDDLSKSNRKGFLQLAADTYFEKTFARASQELPRTADGKYADAVSERVGKIADGAIAFGQQQTDLDKMDGGYRDALDAMTRLDGDDPVTERFRQLGKATLSIGDQVVASDSVSNPTDYIAGTKVQYYEKALQNITTIPNEAKNRTGVDVAVANQYLEGLADEARNSLDAGPQINDFKTRSALYEATLRNLGDRMRQDQNEITNKYRTVIDKALQVADQIKSVWGGNK